MGLFDIVWGPWLAIFVLGVGALATVFTGVIQIRGLPAALSALRRREGMGPNTALASSAGMGAVAGTAIAVSLGGPGAVLWMLVAAILGMGVHFAEAVLGAKARAEDPDADFDPAAHVRPAPGGGALAPIYLLLLCTAAVLAGGAFQVQQGAAALQTSLGIPATAGVVGLLVLAGPFVFVPRLRDRLGAVVPAMIIVYVLVVLTVLASDTAATATALAAVFGGAATTGAAGGGAAGGLTWLAIRHGVMRATFIGESGLGTAAAWADGPPRTAGLRAMLVPLVSTAVLGTLTGLVVVAQGTGDDAVVASRELRPLELPYSRGLRPSARGQTIVLPEDAEMEAGKRYPMVLRSNPRGHAFARLVPEENAIIMPNFQVAEGTDTVVFRETNKFRRDNPGWDVRVPCNRELVDVGNGATLVKLTPKDPSIDLRQLKSRRKLSEPHVVVDDFTFEGSVSTAVSPDPNIGEHLAMFELREDDAPLNPKLREFFSMGYRGPYPVGESVRPPWALAAEEGFLPEVGEVVQLELRANPRGAFRARIDHAGLLEMPPWDFLGRVKEVVVRHNDDPSKDLRIPVTVALDRGRYRLSSTEMPDFRALEEKTGYEPVPYVLAPTYEFDAEVRSDERLAARYKGRRALVPLHEQPEPLGPPETLPYRPHPGEVMFSEMPGPFVRTGEGGQLVVAAVDRSAGILGRVGIALAVVLLVLTTVVAWSEAGARAAASLFGTWAGTPFKALALGVSAAAALSTGALELLDLADGAVGALALVGGLAVLLGLPRLRSTLREDSQSG